MRYYPAGKKCKLDSETPGRAGHFDSLPRCEENPQAMWGTVVDRGPPTGGCPGGPYAGC